MQQIESRGAHMEGRRLGGGTISIICCSAANLIFGRKFNFPAEQCKWSKPSGWRRIKRVDLGHMYEAEYIVHDFNQSLRLNVRTNKQSNWNQCIPDTAAKINIHSFIQD